MTTFPDSGVPGLTEMPWIDGDPLDVGPGVLDQAIILQQFQFATADGGVRLFRPYVGPEYPTQSRHYSWSLPFDRVRGTALEYLDELAADGRLHYFTLWKREKLIYTPPAGQVLYKLPRKRMNAGRFYGMSATYPVMVMVDGVEKSVVYKASVASTDVVPAGEVWWSDTDWRTFALAASGGDAVVKVEYYPLFLVNIVEVSSTYPSTVSESKLFVLAEA